MRQLKITKQITNRDTESFSRYLAEVSNIPMLTPEEESIVAKKAKDGDKDALQLLVKSNLRFVISVAKQYKSQASLPDLVQEGNAGLIKAAERFDESRGFKFISYAVWWIRQSIMQFLAENERNIRLPLNKLGAIHRINQVTTDLEQHLERFPTPDEISEYLMELESVKKNGEPGKYTADKVRELLENNQSTTSLDSPMTSDDDSGTMLDMIEGDNEFDIKNVMKNKDLKIELERVLDRVSYREKETLILYFGLFGKEQKSLEEIGEEFYLTRERVRQIKERALVRLRRRALQTNLKEYR